MKARLSPTLIAVLAIAAVAGLADSPAAPPGGVDGIDAGTPEAIGHVELDIIGRLGHEPITESSGIVRSPGMGGVFWTHNDSGDRARLFAVRADGSVIVPSWWSEPEGEYPGVLLEDAVNIDWEDIAASPDGTLFIGAFGNNGNARRDLGVYVLPEPNPEHIVRTRVARRVDFRLSDQVEFPPDARNFDVEAMGWCDGVLHLLTKHRADTDTKLYRLALDAPGPSVAEYVGRYPIGGMVTAADIDQKGRLAVLTYQRAWVFTPPAGTTDWFAGDARSVEFQAGQCEAITFDGDRLVITNEQRDVFSLPLAELGLSE